MDTEMYRADMEGGIERPGYLFLHTGTLLSITYTEIDGFAIYQGDIILGTAEQMNHLVKTVNAAANDEERKSLASSIITAPGRKWPEGVIFFDYDDSLADSKTIKELITEAFLKFHEQGDSVKFKLRGNNDPNYIRFFKSSGCSSFVGMQDGGQMVNISEKASYGNVMHEICHAAGLWHEHSRNDRDRFVTINFDNIQKGKEGNFGITKAAGLDSGAYDYGSIMHYPRYAFAINPTNSTIDPKDDPTIPIGQRDQLSIGDIAGLKALYPDGS